MTIDQTPLPSIANWPNPSASAAVFWPGLGDRDSRPRQLEDAFATLDDGRQSAPAPSRWPRVFPGL